jgi:hypothetical protein
VGVLPNAHEKVVWFDVAMEDVFFVDGFDSVDHLLAYLQHSFYR